MQKKVFRKSIVLGIIFLFVGTSISSALIESKKNQIYNNMEKKQTKGWTIETIDSGNVSYFSSIDVDTDGYPHISYFDEGIHKLKYSYKDNSGWYTQIVDPENTGVEWGRHNSIALEPDDTPVIAYQSMDNPIPGRLFCIKQAEFDGTWQIDYIDACYQHDALELGRYPSIAVMEDYNGVQKLYSYTASVSNGPSYYGQLRFLWYGSIPEVVTTGTWNYCYDWTSTGFSEPFNQVYVAYHEANSSGSMVRLARRSYGGIWSIETVESGGSTSSGTGTSLAIDSNGYPHISYEWSTSLRYASWTGSSWNITVVDPNYRGGDTSLEIDSNDVPHISYVDKHNWEIKYASWIVDHWEIEPIDYVGSVGGYTSLSLGPDGSPHISYYDRINDDIKYAKKTLDPNNPPNIPSKPSGPITLSIGQSGTYNTSASDPDNDQVQYRFDWDANGAHQYSSWSSLVSSGTPVSMDHSWNSPGTYVIKAEARDEHGEPSQWSEGLTVTVISENQPDLIVKDIAIPNYMIENHQYTLRADIKNIGTANAEYDFKIQFLLWKPDATDWIILSTQNVYSLYPGQCITRDVSWVPEKSGTYLFKVIVDVNGDIAESDETNNQVITSASVLPIIEITPSKKYTIATQTLDISARIHDNLHNKDIKTGTVLWTLYDSNGQQIPGHGGTSDPFVFNSNSDKNCWENLGNDVSDLTNGATYSIKITYQQGNTNAIIAFRKTTGLAHISGYVKNTENNPLIGATVNAYRVFPLPHYNLTTTTDSTGRYSFDQLPAGGYRFKITYQNYLPVMKSMILISDYSYEKDFILRENTGILFKVLLNPMKTSCKNALLTETEILFDMNDKVYTLNDPDLPLMIIDCVGSIMTGTLSSITKEAGEKIGNTIIVNNLEEILPKALERNFHKAVKDQFESAVFSQAINLAAKLGVTLDELIETELYFNCDSLVDTYHSEFQSQAPQQPHINFDFQKADAIIEYVTNQLDNIEDFEVIIIPFDFGNPRDLLLQQGKPSFDTSYDTIVNYQNIENALIVCKFAVGVIGIVLCATVVGAPIGAAMVPVAQGLEVATTVMGYGEIPLSAGLCAVLGIEVGNWANDMLMLPSVMNDNKNFFLNEGINPYYLDKNKDFNVEISDFVFTPDWEIPFFGTKIILAPWNGGNANNPVEIVIKNPAGHPSSNVFALINDNDWRHKDQLSSGGTWSIDNGEYYYTVDPYNLWTTFVPRSFDVLTYAGLPVFSSDSRHVEYYVLPELWKGAIDSGTPLPLSTAKGRLSLDDISELYPRKYPVIDVNLTEENPIFETNYTVASNSSSVEFHMSYLGSAIVDFAVYDSDGNRIGYNYLTGADDMEFLGSFSGKNSKPQIVSIPQATNKTYTVRVALLMEYLANETHYVLVTAYESSSRPAILSVDSTEIILSGATGSNVSIPFMFGEAGMQESLRNVSIQMSDIQKDGVVLPPISDSWFDVGDVLPKTGSSVSFLLNIPQDTTEGEYTGVITINATNAQAIPVNVCVLVSNPPERPSTPSGRSIGVLDVSYSYVSNSSDPEEGPVYYKWNWGDGNISDWLGPYSSGDAITVSHSWGEPGEYMVKVCAKDHYDILSEWSETKVLIINESQMQRTWMIGLISNVIQDVEFTCFNASLVFSFSFRPLDVSWYVSNEKIVVSNEYLGRLRPLGIIGRFDSLVLSESATSVINPFNNKLINSLFWNLKKS